MKCINCEEQAVAKGLCPNCYYGTPEQKLKVARSYRVRQVRVKLEVLTHYGKDGKLQCCWKDCGIVDIDMLTLDHLNDNGGKHLSTSGRKLTGLALYNWARAQNFPEVFQTLCGGHQIKKLIISKQIQREQTCQHLRSCTSGITTRKCPTAI